MNIMYPRILEVNTRLWIKKFESEGKEAKLSNIPESYWDELVKLGIDAIWLMGIWETIPSANEKYCFTEDLVKGYSRVLPDWKKEDVIGSPYAINSYKVNPILGTNAELKKLKHVINKKGLLLILDFIPNHFHTESVMLEKYPEIFLQGGREHLRSDSYTYFEKNDKIFAHGKDPFFLAWQDTVQINYFSEDARKFMKDILLDLANFCDGVRCDMAMLPLNNTFKNTWVGPLQKNNFSVPETEFWEYAIKEVKSKNPDFIFIAEVYWNLEWDLQRLGFDFTYDKTLLDRLRFDSAKSVIEHLSADFAYQSKSLRFIENHDEQRCITALGKSKSKAAMVIISTILGGQLYFEGQFEGKKSKLPVQLGREPQENLNDEIKVFYERILRVSNDKVIRNGSWRLMNINSIGYGDSTNENMLSWLWEFSGEYIWVVVNFSESTSKGRIRLDLELSDQHFKLNDILNNKIYYRSTTEMSFPGLYVELKGMHAHIFKF